MFRCHATKLWLKANERAAGITAWIDDETKKRIVLARQGRACGNVTDGGIEPSSGRPQRPVLTTILIGRAKSLISGSSTVLEPSHQHPIVGLIV